MSHIVNHNVSLHDAFATGLGHARTVVHGKKVVGMVLMRDVIGCVASGADPNMVMVADIMNKTPISITETGNKLAIARKFVHHRIKSLVVTDDEGNYVCDLNPPEAIASLPTGLMGFFQPAERCMIRDPYDISADHGMQEALKRLADHQVSCLLVHDFTGETVGLISESDVVSWIIENQPTQRVSDRMGSPVACMSDQSNLMQVWAEMNTMKVLKMVLLHCDGSVSGLITATDVLCALSQSMLDNFARYHCPNDADMMLEWHKGGMIMAVSDTLLEKLGCQRDGLVGLDWAEGLEELITSNLLGLGARSDMEVTWKGVSFRARRDTEQPMMWWSLV